MDDGVSNGRSVPTLKLGLLVVASWAGLSAQAMAQEVVEAWAPAGDVRTG